MDSDKSLLATLRIILLFLKVYGQLHKRELKWFSHMLKTHLHNEGDREVIMKDFSRTTPLEDLIKDVQEDDKKRLLSWVRIAIWADGNLAPEESEFYNQLSKLLLFKKVMTLEESYKIFAEEIIQSDTRKRVWDELQEAIDFFRRPTSLLQMIFPGLIEVNAFQTGNRFLIIFLIFLGLITGAFILYILN